MNRTTDKGNRDRRAELIRKSGVSAFHDGGPVPGRRAKPDRYKSKRNGK